MSWFPFSFKVGPIRRKYYARIDDSLVVLEESLRIKHVSNLVASQGQPAIPPVADESDAEEDEDEDDVRATELVAVPRSRINLRHFLFVTILVVGLCFIGASIIVLRRQLGLSLIVATRIGFGVILLAFIALLLGLCAAGLKPEAKDDQGVNILSRLKRNLDRIERYQWLVDYATIGVAIAGFLVLIFCAVAVILTASVVTKIAMTVIGALGATMSLFVRKVFFLLQRNIEKREKEQFLRLTNVYEIERRHEQPSRLSPLNFGVDVS